MSLYSCLKLCSLSLDVVFSTFENVIDGFEDDLDDISRGDRDAVIHALNALLTNLINLEEDEDLFFELLQEGNKSLAFVCEGHAALKLCR